jgi:hypothetical protein
VLVELKIPLTLYWQFSDDRRPEDLSPATEDGRGLALIELQTPRSTGSRRLTGEPVR